MSFPSLLTWLQLPTTDQIKNLDDDKNVYVFRKIIKNKPFLYNTYRYFYEEILNKIDSTDLAREFVELGSGAGFLKEICPNITTSDILPYEGVDRVFSALNMPFESSSINAFMMIDVLHHIKDSRQFFAELYRCLEVGGKVVMIEPANTIWSRFVYKNFHHEPFNTRGGWGFKDGGPLTGANMAIPWIIFYRDIELFTKEYPNLKVCSIKIHSPFKYLLSGGLSLRQLLPSWSYSLVQLTEWLLQPFNNCIGMFMTIELEKSK